LHIHADNARPHTANKITEFFAGNSMKGPLRRQYSPGLALCNCNLFRYIKDRLADASSEERDQLLQATDVIFQSIKKATLERVFREWMDRLGQCYVAVGGLLEGM
jgi:hypothetical protein